jgi:hypothetical protein
MTADRKGKLRRKRERRYDRYGPLVKMAEADGWYLIRRPYRLPRAMHYREWERLSKTPVVSGRAALRAEGGEVSP